MVLFNALMNIESLLHDIDSRLEWLMAGEKPTILTTLSGELAIRLNAWEAMALGHDTDNLKRWHQFVIKQNKTAVAPVSLYDPRHKSFFKDLIHRHKVNGNRWCRNNTLRQRAHDDTFWPMAKYIDKEKKPIGFGVFDMNVNHPSYPTFLDQDGTFSEFYCYLLPAMQLSKLLETHRSNGIDHTVVCKGAGEFYRFPSNFTSPDGFKVIGEHFGPPIIPRSEKNAQDHDIVGEDDEESGEDTDTEYKYAPRPESYWDSDTNLERPLRQNLKDDNQSFAEDQDSDDPPADNQSFAEDTNQSLDQDSDDPPAYDDPVQIPKPILLTNLSESKCRLYNPGEEFEIQGGYITALNMKEYFTAVLNSHPVKEAVARKYNQRTSTDKVNRVSIWVCLKAHTLMLSWDTLIDDKGPFMHRVYLSSSFPEQIYFYPDDFRGGQIYKDVLATFIECLGSSVHRGLPIQVFEEIAIRAKLRRLFLRTDVEGFDLNCTAHMMLCTIYQALVLNVVTQPDERGDETPTDELDIETEQKGIARFATLNTKRFFRSLLYKLDTDFRKLLQTNIYDGKLVCFHPNIAPNVISIDSVKLTIFDSIHTQSHIGFNHRAGFVQHKRPARATRR